MVESRFDRPNACISQGRNMEGTRLLGNCIGCLEPATGVCDTTGTPISLVFG